VDGDAPNGDAGGAHASIWPASGGNFGFGDGPDSCGDPSSDDPLGGGQWRVLEALEESRQAWAEPTSPIVSLEGQVGVELAYLCLRYCL
jgi:hypothetical protein